MRRRPRQSPVDGERNQRPVSVEFALQAAENLLVGTAREAAGGGSEGNDLARHRGSLVTWQGMHWIRRLQRLDDNEVRP
jgi:hypothetical protein